MAACDTTSLLIGCGKCDPRRDVYGGSYNSITRKGGIKRDLRKGGPRIPDGQWSAGDLDNMAHLMARKEIDIYSILDYEEHRADGSYARGRHDILNKIDAFFKLPKTYFILYFTGHGDTDGSWCVPVTKLRRKKSSSKSSSKPPVEFYEGTRFAASPVPSSCSTVSEVPSTVTSSPVVVTSSDANDGTSQQRSVSKLLPVNYMNRPAPTQKWNDTVTFEDVLDTWDKNRSGRGERYLMLILDCSHSGRWVEMVNSLTVETSGFESSGASTDVPVRGKSYKKPCRGDICVQASCGAAERAMVARNQFSSFFTRAFVAAQSKSLVEKLVLSAIDHAFVLNIVSLSCYGGAPFTSSPISTANPPFGGIQFYDSFDDMHLTTW